MAGLLTGCLVGCLAGPGMLEFEIKCRKCNNNINDCRVNVSKTQVPRHFYFLVLFGLPVRWMSIFFRRSFFLKVLRKDDPEISVIYDSNHVVTGTC